MTCDCWPGAPCEGHEHHEVLSIEQAVLRMVRVYLKQHEVHGQAIVDPADLWAWARVSEAHEERLAHELAAQLATWALEPCACRGDDPECRYCLGVGEVERECPRILLGDGPHCCRCLAPVGDHDSVCPRGHALIVEDAGLPLELALRMSTSRAANDVEVSHAS